MVPPRKPPRLLVPRDVTETARQGQGIGDIEAMRQMATRAVPEILGMAPVTGELMSLYEAGKAAAEGDKLGAGLALAGAIPIAGTVGRVAGRAGKVGREMLERSRLVGRPIDFEAEKSGLAKLLRGEAQGPLPAAMRDRPIISAEHSTPYLFRAPEISRGTAGKGAGDWWQGPGFYISESKGPRGVSGHYREETAFVPQFVRTPAGVIVDRDALLSQSKKLPTGDRRNTALTNLLTASDEYYTSPDELLDEVRSLREQAVNTQRELASAGKTDKPYLREQLQDLQDRLSATRQFLTMGGEPRLPERIPQDLRQATYSVEFAARPDEIFDLQRSVADQPSSERLMAALRSVETPNESELPLSEALRLWERKGEAPFGLNEMLVGNKTLGLSDKFDGLDRFRLMNELNERGIVGNRYLTRLSAENPNLPQEYNYVVQDPSRVRLTDVWAAAPIGLALNAVDKQQRKQEPQAKR